MVSFYKHIQWALILSVFLLPLLLSAQPKVIQTNEQGDVRNDYYINDIQKERIQNKLLWNWVEQGFLYASMDSVGFNADTTFYNLWLGPKQDLHKRTAKRLLRREKELSKYWNSGYPFAQMVPDSIYYSGEGKILTSFKITKGPLILFDSLRVFGDVNYGKSYLHSAAGIKPLEEFSERRYQEISARLSKMKSARLKRTPDIGFAGGKATVILNLEKQKADKFEGILGILPSQESNTTEVTGYINLELNNLFRSGKQFYFNWNRFAPSAQSLDLHYGHPFFLQSPVELISNFSLLRQDSLFVKRDFSLTFSLPINQSIDFFMTLSTKASDILGAEPDSNLGLDYRLTDYRPGLRVGNNLFNRSYLEGFQGQLAFGFGDKQIRRNQLFPIEVYDTVRLRSSNYELDLSLSGQKVVGSKMTLFSKLHVGLLEGQEILRNEFYRIGGLRSLRGFNENTFFAQRFGKLQSELRIFFESSSYLFALIDLATIETAEDNFVTNSIGGGLSLQIESGHFEFVFAMGAIDQFAFDFQSTKVHFGYSITF